MSWFAVLAGLAFAGPVAAGDLLKIDRSLRREPIYQSKSPLYCLLVFGPEAKVRVWVVLDGNVLYLDRNGNGDLTDPGERIAAEEVYSNREESPDVKVMRRFELNCRQAGDEPILTCGPEVQWFHVAQVVPREDWHDQSGVVEPRAFDVTTKAGHCQRAEFRFAISPQEAPVLHFDGPRRLALSGTLDPPRFRPGESCELAVEMQTQGWNGKVRTDFAEVPEDVHPVAEIEFPPGRPGEDPIRLHVELKERC